MSDLEQFKNMMGRVQKMKEEIIDDTIVLTLNNVGECGYSGFFSEWTFDKETGRLLFVAHWE